MHVVFTVKGRQSLIIEDHREELQKYICGIIQEREQKLLSIFCMPDHTHLLIGIKPNIAISDLVRDIKAGSSGFVNKKKWTFEKFNWQEGFGVFSYSKSQIDQVIQYISSQKQHHQKKNFKEEYIDLLNKFDVKYDEKYLFEWIN